jgi:hypothetical protein
MVIVDDIVDEFEYASIVDVRESGYPNPYPGYMDQ